MPHRPHQAANLCPRCMIDGSAALLRAIEEAGPAPVACRPTVRGLVAHAAALFGVPANEIAGRGRARRIARPRQIAAWVAHKASGRSWSEIGRTLGGRDHSTMIHAARQVEAFSARDPEFLWTVERLWCAGECEPWGPGGVEAALLPPPREQPPVAAAVPEQPTPLPVVAIMRPGEYVPRHALPPVFAVVDFDREGPVADDGDRDVSLRRAGTDQLLAALRREHPERCAA